MTHSNTSEMDALIRKHLENPTKEMHVAFSSLSSTHKWLLFSLLDVGGFAGCRVDTLRQSDERLCPKIEERQFSEVLAELTEGFLERRVSYNFEEVDWIHPSCRDLTIDELSNSSANRKHFLKRCSVEGLRLAISIGGGAEGRRFMPLIKSENDWITFERHCLELETEGRNVLYYLWFVHQRLSENSEPQSTDFQSCRLESVLTKLWPVFYELNKDSSGPSPLRVFLELRLRFAPSSPFPGLMAHWSEAVEQVEDSSHISDSMKDLASAAEDFAEVVETIYKYEPSFFSSNVCEGYTTTLNNIRDRASNELGDNFEKKSVSDLKEMKKIRSGWHDLLMRLSELPLIAMKQSRQIREYAYAFDREVDEIEDCLSDKEKADKKISNTVALPLVEPPPDISIEELFKDL